MIRSMTAFSRMEANTTKGLLTWEIRSVNHRFSEVNLRIPEDLRSLETKFREIISAHVKRGKIDANFRFQAVANEDQSLEIDTELVSKLAHTTREIDQMLYNPAPINALDVMRWPGVLKAPEQDLTQLGSDATALLEKALGELLTTRQREGEQLKATIEARCSAIEEQVKAVSQQLPEALQTMRKRLEERLAEIKGELDPARIEQEIVILANKADVDEELDRLTTHVAEVRRVLGQEEPIGRRLDFLMQELNREANTLGSKSINTDITNASVELKVLIEQMREQIQNIE
jgi:uncharacterized protein (TIGR00255 family)